MGQMVTNSPRNAPPLDWEALIIGLTIGFIIGAALALFKAPVSGRELRQQIRDKVTQTGRQVRERVEADPLADSLEAGKAAARQRQSAAR
jgi:gas vesicle protein